MGAPHLPATGTCVYDGVVGKRNRTEHRRLNADLPAPGKLGPRRLRFNEHPGLRKRVLESFWLQDTIRARDSTGYNPEGGPKESVDQDSRLRFGAHSPRSIWVSVWTMALYPRREYRTASTASSE